MIRIALCFQKWKPMIWVDTCSNFRTHNAGSLSTQFITFLGVKSSFFIAFFHLITSWKSLQLQQVRWLAWNGFFSTFHLCSTCTNQRTCSTCRDWYSRFATRFFDKKSRKRVKSMSQTRTNLSKTWLQTWSKTRFAARFAAGYRIMECGLY